MTRTSSIAAILAAFCLAETAVGQSADDIAAYEQRIEEQARQLDEMRRELDELKAVVEQESEDAEPTTAEPQTASPAPTGRFVWRRNENLTVAFTGRLHRMLLSVDDGASTDVFYTDSEQGPTVLRFDATAQLNDALSVGATVEIGIRQNRPFLVSQDNREGGTGVTSRIAEGFVDSSRFGKLSFGRGFASGWLAPEIDLSGTQFASLLPVGMLAPGMKFVDASDNSLSDVQVATHFADVQRLLLVDRFRYDSPSLGPGLQVSSSVANDGRWDATLRAKPQPSDTWTLVAGGSFQKKPFDNIDRRIDFAVSARHEPTGLNLTVGAVNERLTVSRDANTYLVKGGWLTDIFSFGKTAFSIDYYQVSDLRLQGDEASSVGLFAVQKWADYGLDIYTGYRVYDVTRSDLTLEPLDIFVLGLAFNF